MKESTNTTPNRLKILRYKKRYTLKYQMESIKI